MDFKEDHTALLSLSASDPKLGVLIDTIGGYRLSLRTDFFTSLARAIIGQQLSVKAARTIWTRIVGLCEQITPEAIHGLSEDRLREVGVSRPKISYLKDLSGRILSGEISLDGLHLLEDTEVVGQLTKIRGIGAWTAEMFLIFSLGRLNVLSLDDIGLRRGVKWLYNLEEQPGKSELTHYGTAWEPFRTVASLYLWEAVNRSYIATKPEEVLNLSIK